MIFAYHLIISAYGHWLPNDPRGSWSPWVRSWDLFRAGGPATKTDNFQSQAHAPHDRDQRIATKAALRYEPVCFSGVQARAVGRGFAIACEEARYRIHACAILPDHVHLIVGRDGTRRIEQIRTHLKRSATRELRSQSLHPLQDIVAPDQALPSPWSRFGWQVYIDTIEGVVAAIQYVHMNPIRQGLPPQHWSFTVPFEM